MSTETLPFSAAAKVPTGGSNLTGTGTLLRFMLRRDRLRLPFWTVGISLFVPYFFTAFQTIFPEPSDLRAAAAFSEGPIGALLGGPGYGLGVDISYTTFFAAIYGQYFLLAACLMNILLISRHTRVDEQTGRSELVRANVVGKHAPLTAAIVLAVLTNLALVAVLGLALIAVAAPPASAVLFAVGTGAIGLVFAGVTVTTVQVSEYSRVGSGLAGAVLGAAFVVRAAGDMFGEHGSTLSWLSPLAWSQQTRVFADDRWWPLAVSSLVAAATIGAGFALSARRDLGAGLRQTRPGSARAARWLRSPLALAWRLHRAGLRGWLVGIAVAGIVYGGITEELSRSMSGMTPAFRTMLGAETDVLNGYLDMTVSLIVVATAIYVVLAIQRARSEKLEGRAEMVLATATSKARWLGSHLAVSAIGATLLVTVGCAASGVSAALVTGDPNHIGRLVVAGLVATPGVLVVLGVAALLNGLGSALLPWAWALVGFASLIEFFGPLLDPPRWLSDLSPWTHTPAALLESVTATPLVAQTTVAGVGIALALWAFRRRDLASG